MITIRIQCIVCKNNYLKPTIKFYNNTSLVSSSAVCRYSNKINQLFFEGIFQRCKEIFLVPRNLPRGRFSKTPSLIPSARPRTWFREREVCRLRSIDTFRPGRPYYMHRDNDEPPISFYFRKYYIRKHFILKYVRVHKYALLPLYPR